MSADHYNIVQNNDDLLFVCARTMEILYKISSVLKNAVTPRCAITMKKHNSLGRFLK